MANRRRCVVLAVIGMATGCSDPYAHWWQKDAPASDDRDAPRTDAAADAPAPDAPADGPSGLAYALELTATGGVETLGSASTAVGGWRDGSPAGHDATTVAGSPTLTTTMVNGHPHPVIHFSGGDYMTVPVHVTESGALFVVYANADHGAADRRVLGWEDSHAGMHGLGIAPDYHGGNELVVVARNGGTDLDHHLAPAATGMEIDVVAWDASGVTVIRRTLDGATVIAPPQWAIPPDDGGYALHLGAPGDAGATDVLPFVGDLAAVRLVVGSLDPTARHAIIEELAATWF